MKLILMIISLLLLGWTWEGHEMLAKEFYFSLPDGMQGNMSLSQMKEGAIAPDKVFRDNVRHHYPPSFQEAQKWLNKTALAIEIQNYSEASYDFGVVSHYISDSFAAPHNVKKESSKLHAMFEKQALVGDGRVECAIFDYDLNTSLFEAQKNGEKWNEWLETKTPDEPRREFIQAMSLIYSVGHKAFNTTCSQRITKVDKMIYVSPQKLFYFLMILILFIAALRFF